MMRVRLVKVEVPHRRRLRAGGHLRDGLTPEEAEELDRLACRVVERRLPVGTRGEANRERSVGPGRESEDAHDRDAARERVGALLGEEPRRPVVAGRRTEPDRRSIDTERTHLSVPRSEHAIALRELPQRAFAGARPVTVDRDAVRASVAPRRRVIALGEEVAVRARANERAGRGPELVGGRRRSHRLDDARAFEQLEPAPRRGRDLTGMRLVERRSRAGDLLTVRRDARDPRSPDREPVDDDDVFAALGDRPALRQRGPERIRLGSKAC